MFATKVKIFLTTLGSALSQLSETDFVQRQVELHDFTILCYFLNLLFTKFRKGWIFYKHLLISSCLDRSDSRVRVHSYNKNNIDHSFNSIGFLMSCQLQDEFFLLLQQIFDLKQLLLQLIFVPLKLLRLCICLFFPLFKLLVPLIQFKQDRCHLVLLLQQFPFLLLVAQLEILVLFLKQSQLLLQIIHLQGH